MTFEMAILTPQFSGSALNLSAATVCYQSFPPHVKLSLNWLRIWEFPASIQNFLLRSVETHDVVPALHDRMEIIVRLGSAAVDKNGPGMPRVQPGEDIGIDAGLL